MRVYKIRIYRDKFSRSTKSLILDDAEIVRSTKFASILKIAKIFKKYIKFDLQKYFNINIVFNSLNQLFELLNL
jgi:hypothetical protein